MEDEVVQSLFDYSNAIAARLSALEVLTDALIGTIGKSLPPLLPVLQENLQMLAMAREGDMHEGVLNGFRAHIEEADRKIEAVK
ncbi:hypothetical protein WKW79_13665 [Variovorax robiniae]|uniref:Uncharacterized protein n=1 Tax=Variovorax robiniae TaxID=1836199 RepID=A0ABU8X773_9BURK